MKFEVEVMSPEVLNLPWPEFYKWCHEDKMRRLKNQELAYYYTREGEKRNDKEEM